MSDLTDLEERCIARRMYGIDEYPWFLALGPEDQCEALLIAHLLGVQDARDIQRAAARAQPTPAPVSP